MKRIGVLPQDILPEGVDHVEVGGKPLRKGTVAAFLANINLYENEESTDEQKHQALMTMRELAPDIIAVGLYKHVVFKNPEVEKMLAMMSRAN